MLNAAGTSASGLRFGMGLIVTCEIKNLPGLNLCKQSNPVSFSASIISPRSKLLFICMYIHKENLNAAFISARQTESLKVQYYKTTHRPHSHKPVKVGLEETGFVSHYFPMLYGSVIQERVQLDGLIGSCTVLILKNNR